MAGTAHASDRCVLWGNGIDTAGILRSTVLTFVTVNETEQPIKKIKFFPLPQSLYRRPPADQEA